MDKEIHAVTGAFGYSGKYIARKLIDEGHRVITITNSLDRKNPFGDKIKIYPFYFDEPAKLKETLQGVSVLYNTYWVRFNHKTFTHADAVQNTEKMIGYKILYIFFLIFHTILIIFILLGWIFKKFRRLNLLVILLTMLSWTLLGLIFGFGYCPLTDWHFNVLEKLGRAGLPSSYIKYLADRLTGYNFDQRMVDTVTLVGLISAFLISAYVNIRDRLIRKK